ncbi:hypothetical protein [Actinomadura sp. 6K520]|jgi:5-methylcytosine-specific restriction enzyme subunit McrC|uniref:hypothetical protein n=1 Tax=Actinomadura sp. 6K520 TaxID=2530364 RepID=UPI001404BBF5|nr:hypothetical protein [Actinomadura sp. 6K520]
MRLNRAYLVFASKTETHTHGIAGTEDIQIVEHRAQITGLARRIVAETARLRA